MRSMRCVLIGVVAVLVSCSGSGNSGGNSGGNSESSSYPKAVSIFCPFGKDFSSCIVSYSDGHDDYIKYPPTGNLVTVLKWIGWNNNERCIKLYENGGVADCQQLSPWAVPPPSNIILPKTVYTPPASITPTIPLAIPLFSVGADGPGAGIVVEIYECTTTYCKYLEMAKKDLGGTYTWDQAILAANKFSNASADDWTLPTKDQMYSIVMSRVSSSLKSVPYWTSTDQEVEIGSAYFNDGITGKENKLTVRPVRLATDYLARNPGIAMNSTSSSSIVTETTQVSKNLFKISAIKVYTSPGGSPYEQWFSISFEVEPNGNHPKSLCLFIDGQPYNGVIGTAAAYPVGLPKSPNCENYSGRSGYYNPHASGEFRFSLNEYLGAIEGDKHEVSMKWEFEGKPTITSPVKNLVFHGTGYGSGGTGRWVWGN